MFGIGSTELLVILIVALVVLGPKSLPGIAKTVGKVMGEFRRVSTEFQRTMNAEVAHDEHEKRKKEAEEELFGKEEKKTADASTAKPSTTADKVTADNAADTAEKAAETVVDTVATEKTSPLADAVAKAEKEAESDTTATPTAATKEKELA